MTINSRSEYDAAVKRQQELQRAGGADPNRQRELQQLTADLESWRASNPGASKEDDERARLAGQASFDPHNQNNVSKPGESVNDRGAGGAPAGQQQGTSGQQGTGGPAQGGSIGR